MSWRSRNPLSGKPASYSKAFENIVENDDDLVGLLAYALFKQSVREGAQLGSKSPLSRDPSASVVRTYRQSAERKLESFATAVIEDAKAGLTASAAVQAIETAKSELRGFIRERTSFGTGVWVAIVGWAITLVLTIAIVWLAGKAAPSDTILDAGKNLTRAKAAVQSAATPKSKDATANAAQ